MPKRIARDTKTKILEKAYGLFYKKGFAGVSVDAIAKASGITKRSLYYHFTSKDEIIAEVLDHQRAYTLKQIKSWSDKESTSSEIFLLKLFENLSLWATDKNWLGSGFTRISMELADRPGHPARASAKKHKAEIELWLAQELTRLGAQSASVLAPQVMILVEGCMTLILIHGDTSYAEKASKAAVKLVSAEN